MNDLNLDVHNAEGLGADVNLDQTRIHGFVELSEPLDKSDRSLLNAFERVGARAAGNGTQEADTATQTMHHGTVDPMGDLSGTEILSVGRLHLAPLQGFDMNDLLAQVGLLHNRGRGLFIGDYTKTCIRKRLLGGHSSPRSWNDRDSP